MKDCGNQNLIKQVMGKHGRGLLRLRQRRRPGPDGGAHRLAAGGREDGRRALPDLPQRRRRPVHRRPRRARAPGALRGLHPHRPRLRRRRVAGRSHLRLWPGGRGAQQLMDRGHQRLPQRAPAEPGHRRRRRVPRLRERGRGRGDQGRSLELRGGVRGRGP